MRVCLTAHVCVHVCSPYACVCMCMRDGFFVEGVVSRSWKVLKVGVLVVVVWGVGSYLAGCKKMPPGLLMEETGISSETSIVPACH